MERTEHHTSRPYFDLLLRLVDNGTMDVVSRDVVNNDTIWLVLHDVGENRPEWLPEVVAHFLRRRLAVIRAAGEDLGESKLIGFDETATRLFEDSARREPSPFVRHVLPVGGQTYYNGEIYTNGIKCFGGLPDEALQTYGGTIKAFCSSRAFAGGAFWLIRALEESRGRLPGMTREPEYRYAYRPAATDDETLSRQEKAEREEATVWVDGLDRINAACGIDVCIDLSATPFYLQGSGYPEGSPFPWIVSDFSLVDAIECGITKIPRIPASDSTGRPDPKYFKLWEHITRDLKAGERLSRGRPKPEVVYRRAEDALLTLAGEWKERFNDVLASAPGEDRTPPVMIVVCDNTDIATHFHRMISGEEVSEEDSAGTAARSGNGRTPSGASGRRAKARKVTHYGAGLNGFPELWNRDGSAVTLRIDSKLLEAAESGDPTATRKEAAEELRKIVSTIGQPGEPGAQFRCVVSVNMLSEGWDAHNVTNILGLRAFLLCEQVVGRGLRRMDYIPDPKTGLLTAEYVDIFGVPFSLIPFKSRQPGKKTPPDERTKHEVMALPARKAFEIRFPVVEGTESIRIDPFDTPTAAFIRPQVSYQIGHPSAYGGFGIEMVNRQQYYDSVHPQTMTFEIAREVVRQLAADGTNGGARASRGALLWLSDPVPSPDPNAHRRMLVCVAAKHVGLHCTPILREYIENCLSAATRRRGCANSSRT